MFFAFPMGNDEFIFFLCLGHRTENLFKAPKSVNLLNGEVSVLPLFKQNQLFVLVNYLL